MTRSGVHPTDSMSRRGARICYICQVNPVGALSVMDLIMGAESPGEKCDPLLYSLVFGESVLNDAVAIVLFHTFTKFYFT